MRRPAYIPSIRTLRSAARLIAAGFVLSAVCTAAATAQRRPAPFLRPGAFKGAQRGVRNPNRPGVLAPDAVRARQTLALFLREGMRQPYRGEQITRLLEGQVRESQQIVKYAGPGKERIEYTAPPSLRGEIILISGDRLLRYEPRANRIYEGPAVQEEFRARIQELIQAVRAGRARRANRRRSSRWGAITAQNASG
jgi:hypothetical protein